MTWLDVVIILIVALYALLGWRRGFLFVLTDLLRLSLSLLLALLLYRYVATMLEIIGLREALLANVLAFIIIFFIADTVYWLAVRRPLRRVPERVVRSAPNRVAGVVLGTAKGLLISALLLLVLTLVPGLMGEAAIEDSAIAEPMLGAGSRLERMVTTALPDDLREGLTFITTPPEDEETVDIPVRTDIRIDSEAEARMLEMINAERREHGLRPLEMDPELRDVARKHSRDMFQRGFFSHVNPDGENPFDRMREEGIRFGTAGENLAMAPTVRIAHEGLMQSPGHRANILNRSFGKVGIGVYASSGYNKVFTQVFTN